MLAERIRFIITDDSGNKTDVWSLRGSLISSLYSRFLPIQMIPIWMCQSLPIYCAFTPNHLLQTFFRTRGRRVRVNAGVGESGAKVVSVWDCGLVWPRMYNNELFWKLLTMTAWLIMEMQFTNFLMMLYTRLSFITDLTANTHLCVLLDVQDWVQKPSSISWKCRKPP